MVISGKLLSNGKTCGWIQTKENCEAAARFLGLRDTEASLASNDARPRGCFYHGALYFNLKTQSQTVCTRRIPCLCRADDGKYEY